MSETLFVPTAFVMTVVSSVAAVFELISADVSSVGESLLAALSCISSELAVSLTFFMADGGVTLCVGKGQRSAC